MTFRSPWMTTAEAAAYLRFEKSDGSPDRKRALDYLDRAGAKTVKRGRTVLVWREDVEQAVEVRAS